jgi:hypothetical protein
VRIILVLALLATCAPAQSQLSKILNGELDRNFKILKQKGDPPPYFMGYSVTDRETDVIVASAGSVDAQNHNHSRLLDITVRVGTPKFDNYRRVNGQIPRFTVTMPLPLEDNAAAIRQTAWLATDRVYRNASQRLIQIKADEKLRAAATDGSDDFSTEQPQTFNSEPPKLRFNAADWSARLRKLRGFAKYPGALNSDISVQAERVMESMVSAEYSARTRPAV